MMADFLVVWKDDADAYFQSKVTLNDGVDLGQMGLHDWVKLAAKSEGYEDFYVDSLIYYGYDLILVCSMPDKFYLGG